MEFLKIKKYLSTIIKRTLSIDLWMLLFKLAQKKPVIC